MLRTLLRFILPFSASIICTLLVGQYLYRLAAFAGWYTAIGYWALGAVIGFSCAVVLPQGYRWALMLGGGIASVGLAVPLIANSMGIAFFVLFPFFVLYAAIQGAAYRHGVRYSARRALMKGTIPALPRHRA